VPLTWQPSELLRVHVNVGRDFIDHEPDQGHGGVAVEWTPRSQATFVAEFWREQGVKLWRLGARWNATPHLGVDFSRTQGRGDAAPSFWTVGVNWVFDRH
jgi:hypothetical protein